MGEVLAQQSNQLLDHLKWEEGEIDLLHENQQVNWTYTHSILHNQRKYYTFQ